MYNVIIAEGVKKDVPTSILNLHSFQVSSLCSTE